MNWYLGLKAIHVAFVLVFIGGLLAQSLIVAAGRRGADAVTHFARWDSRVTVPAMLVVWMSGAALAASGGHPWLWAKLAFVVALSGIHGVQSGVMRRVRSGEGSTGSIGSYRRAAFVALSAAAISALVVTRPF
jgi:putative membrane protein